MTTETATIAHAIAQSLAADEAAAVALVDAAHVTYELLPHSSLRKVIDAIFADTGRKLAPNTVSMYATVGHLLSLDFDPGKDHLTDIDAGDDAATAYEGRKLVNACARTCGQAGIKAILAQSQDRASALRSLAQAARPTRPTDQDQSQDQSQDTEQGDTPTTTDADRLESIRSILKGMTDDGTVPPVLLTALRDLLPC